MTDININITHMDPEDLHVAIESDSWAETIRIGSLEIEMSADTFQRLAAKIIMYTSTAALRAEIASRGKEEP